MEPEKSNTRAHCGAHCADHARDHYCVVPDEPIQPVRGDGFTTAGNLRVHCKPDRDLGGWPAAVPGTLVGATRRCARGSEWRGGDERPRDPFRPTVRGQKAISLLRTFLPR